MSATPNRIRNRLCASWTTFACLPGKAIYIGDSRVDEQFAANAGVPFVAYRNPELTANYYLDSFAAGPDLIRGLIGNESLESRRKS